LRRRKIPPDSWEDVSYDKQCWLPYRVADRLVEKNWTGYAILKHMMDKFGLSLKDARDVAEMAEYRRPKVPEGCMVGYKERRERTEEV
jgi:hypothetical protein